MEKIAISYTFDNEEITGVLFYNLGERNERATLSLPMVIPAFNRWSSLREMLMKTFDVCPSPPPPLCGDGSSEKGCLEEITLAWKVFRGLDTGFVSNVRHFDEEMTFFTSESFYL